MTPGVPAEGRPIGSRVEDEALLRGATRFTDDLPNDGQLTAMFVRSKVAAGRILRVRADLARAEPGVVAVITAADLDLPALKAYPPVLNQKMPQPLLAGDLVRYAGEPVAIVAAETPEAAVDAAALVDVDIDATEVLLDARRAADGAPLLHEEAGTNVALSLKFSRPVRGDLFDGCEVVVGFDTRSQRVAACPMEVRTTIAEWSDGVLRYHAGTQAPKSWGHPQWADSTSARCTNTRSGSTRTHWSEEVRSVVRTAGATTNRCARMCVVR